MPLISLSEVCRYYQVGHQPLHVLKNVSLSIDQGAFVALMGPSGSGKSTLMNQIGCLDQPNSGKILFDGKPLSDCSFNELAAIRCHSIGFVFQQFNLLSRLSALENVALPLLYAGQCRQEARTVAMSCLQRVGLGDRWSHRPSELSGGQQQRVAIARAIVNQPKLILADEPTGALDTHTGNEIMKLFTELNEQGITIVLVTHEPEVAEFANRVLMFRDGRLVSDSAESPKPEEVVV